MLTAGRVERINMRHRAKFRGIGHTVAATCQFFDFPKMAAIRHLEFVMRMFGPPTKGIWWSLPLCKIWL